MSVRLRAFATVAAVLLLFCSGLTAAQTQSSQRVDVLLILDASGSMFNRLDDGRYRITAAKDALGAFISRLPESDDLHVGLRVYGSRLDALDEGSCQDSLLSVPVSRFDRGRLLAAVQETQARGATPIAYSLELAVEDLRDAPGRKLIVLVTDGEEGCNGDVRAAAELLSGAGFEIDLRIIGFDLTELSAQAFAAIGAFENATSAAELAAALGRAVDLPQAQETHLVTVLLTRSGVGAQEGATVTFVDGLGGEEFHLGAQGDGRFTAGLPAGSYRAVVSDAFSETPLTFTELAVAAEAENYFEFELASGVEVVLTVTPSDPVTGAQVEVSYSGAPAGARGWITVVPVTADVGDHLSWANASGADGVVEVQLPVEPVELEARYHLYLPEDGSLLVGRSATFRARAVETSLTAPAEVAAGSTFEVEWQGPGNATDYVTIVPRGAPEGAYFSHFYARDGSTGTLVAPAAPGEYEIRYIASPGGILASRGIAVSAALISLTLPTQAGAGQSFEVAWEGPDNSGDYLTIVPVGAAEGTYLSYANTRTGSLLELEAPLDPGSYEVRYVAASGGTLASAPIEVVAVASAVTAPAQVGAGDQFEVRWLGPDAPNDYLTIVPQGAPEGAYLSFAYTRSGATLVLTAPDQPGSYEVRYVHAQSNRTLASSPIEVR